MITRKRLVFYVLFFLKTFILRVYTTKHVNSSGKHEHPDLDLWMVRIDLSRQVGITPIRGKFNE